MERYFLTTGTAKYPHLKNADLPRVVEDLPKVRDLLEKACGMKPFPESVATQGRSIGEQLELITEWNLEPNAEGAAVVLFQSSHGVVVNQSFFLCDETSRYANDEILNRETLISVERIAHALCGGRTKQLLLILDTCHAAAGIGSIGEVFRQFDDQFRGTQDLKVHVLVACRTREEATDGLFAGAFIDAVHSVGARNPERRYLDLREVVRELRSRIADRQTVELREVLDQDGECRRLPNPSFRTVVDRFRQADLVQAVEALVADLGLQQPREIEQLWLWYAWFENGRFKHDRLDKGWRPHLNHRAERGLEDGKVCRVISLLEGFAELYPGLQGGLHQIQADWNRVRAADLELSRSAGRKRFGDYQQWRKTLIFELQVTYRTDAAWTIQPVGIGSSGERTTRDPLPLTTEASGDLARVLTELSDLAGVRVKKVPIRLLLPISQLSGVHLNLPYYGLQSIRQSAPLTVHSLERWCLLHGAEVEEARRWKDVLHELRQLRREMDPATAVRAHDPTTPQSWQESLKAAVPVILVKDQSGSEKPENWKQWPEVLRQHWQSYPNATAFLVFDAPDFTPWDLPSNLAD